MMIETSFHLLSGAEVYIVQSSNYKSSIVANNSVIVHQQDPCVNCKPTATPTPHYPTLEK